MIPVSAIQDQVHKVSNPGLGAMPQSDDNGVVTAAPGRRPTFPVASLLPQPSSEFTPSPIFSLIFDTPTYPVAYILPQLSSELTSSSHFSDSELTPIHPKSGCS